MQQTTTPEVLNLMNVRTGQYITPTPETFKAWQEGRRPWLIHLHMDKEKDLLFFQVQLIRAKEHAPHKVEYYKQIIQNIIKTPNQ